jgi:hypothetical protein
MFYGIHGLPAGRQFKLLAVQASGITNIIAMGSNDAIKGTAVQILDSSFTSVPAVPYFGCYAL